MATRVRLVGPLPPPVTGVSEMFGQLASDLATDAVTPLVLDTADHGKQRFLDGFHLRGAAHSARTLAQLAAHLVRHRADVSYLMVSQTPVGFVRDAAYIRLCHAADRRVVLHLHGGRLRELYRAAGPALRALMRRTFARVELGIVLGEGLRDQLEGLLPPQRVRVVPNGVAPPWPPVQLPRPARDEVRVGYLGALDEQKGFFDLLRALPLLRQRVHTATLHLAGRWDDPRLKARAEAFVTQAQLAECVRFVGVVRDEQKDRFLRELDILALPTRFRFEGLPVVLLEGAAYGLPLVSTPRAAIPDVVLEGQTGLLVPEGDSHALLEALSRLALDAGLREQLGRNARDHVAQHFSRAAYVNGVRAALLEVVRDGVGVAPT